MFVLAVIGTISIVLCGIAYTKAKTALLESIHQQIEQAASAKVSFVTEWVASRQAVAASALPRFGTGVPLKPILDQAKDAGSFDDMYIGQPDKTMTQFSNAVPVPPGYDPTIRPWYIAAAGADTAIASAPYIDAATKLPIITFAKARKDNGQLVAVAGGDVQLKRIVEEILSSKLPGDGYAFLATKDGQIIAHPAKDSLLKKATEIMPGLDMSEATINGKIMQTTIGGENMLSALFPVGNTGWVLGIMIPEAKATAPIQSLMMSMFGLMIVGLIIAFFATSFGISRMMSGILALSEAMGTMSRGGGDLTVSLPVDSSDEVGATKDSFNRFIATLRSMFNDVKGSTNHLLSGIERVGSATDHISNGSKEQANAANATAAAVEEMTASISHIAESAKNAELMTQESGNASRELATDVRATAEEISLISTTIQQLQSVLQGLDSRSMQISNIVAVIKEIADQTNLLALNAAIEAARAGEQGRGFAVVADEVRKLAERTGVSTVEIGNMIHLIQEETKTAVASMNEAVNQVQRGVEKSQSVTHSIQRIEQSAQEVEHALASIASATSEQSAASHEIARNIARIHDMSESADASIQATQTETEQLRRLAQELRGLMDKFRV